MFALFLQDNLWKYDLYIFSKSTAASTLAGVHLDLLLNPYFLCFYLYSIHCIIFFFFHTLVPITYDTFA